MTIVCTRYTPLWFICFILIIINIVLLTCDHEMLMLVLWCVSNSFYYLFRFCYYMQLHTIMICWYRYVCLHISYYYYSFCVIVYSHVAIKLSILIYVLMKIVFFYIRKFLLFSTYLYIIIWYYFLVFIIILDCFFIVCCYVVCVSSP